jgi:C4-dicarboxylate transporter DctM subunit
VLQREVTRFVALCFNQSEPMINPIWFGVIIVMTVELGLIHPPVGMNVFVIKSVVQDVSFSTIFIGVLPFIVTDLIRLVILIAFPILALWLPSHM